ncbi:MAG: DUF5658 family protein [Steroidobacteraceae bacterium]
MSSRDALKVKPEMADAVDAPSGADMSHAADSSRLATDRRNDADRRKRTLYSLVYGSFNPRRRGTRRTDARSLRDLDWHHPQWLAVAMLIVVLSCVDAALTLTLIAHGAYEVNPLMASIVGGSALIFTVVKVGLTAGGVVLLTLAARMRAFGKIPVGFLLYAVLVGYGTLVIYELRLLEEVSL